MKKDKINKLESLIGTRFNKLVVVSINLMITNNLSQSLMQCICDCGNTKIAKVKCLKAGQTGSCGCLKFGIKSLKDPLEAKISSARVIYRDSYSDGNLTFDDFLQISQMNCFYCNEPPQNVSNPFKNKKTSSQFSRDNGNYVYNGLDRIDNDKPHDKENVVACCKWCNYSKRERSLEDFKSWAIRVASKLGELDG